jgi:CYTH domain-containing protein
MELVPHTKEIEQRYVIDPSRWLYLPKRYLEYHQAEIGSWQITKVITEFRAQTAGLLTGYEAATGRMIESLFSQIATTEQIKLRIRRILDPIEHSLRAEFTLKKKFPSKNGFKLYEEYNLPIHPILWLSLIEHIAPRHVIPRHVTWIAQNEYGVRKFRYNIFSSDKKKWDIDIFQWKNAGLGLWEVEVGSIQAKVRTDAWAVKKVNGDPELKFLGTAELQKTPYDELPEKQRALIRSYLLSGAQR